MTGPIVYVQNADGIFFKLAEGKGTNDAVIHLANQDQGVRVLGAEEFPVQGEVVKIASLMGFIKLKLNRYAIIANTWKRPVDSMATFSIECCNILSYLPSLTRESILKKPNISSYWSCI